MTLAEFKAWFEGFTEGMEGSPTPKQWKRIKARVAQIDGVAVTHEVVYRDRYWPTITNRPLEPYVTWCGTGSAIGSASAVSNGGSDLIALGKAEYSEMASA